MSDALTQMLPSTRRAACPYKAWRPVRSAGTGRFKTFGEYQDLIFCHKTVTPFELNNIVQCTLT